MLLLASFCFLAASVWPLSGIIIADNQRSFSVISIESINIKTVRIEWKIEEKLIKQLHMFNLVACINTSAERNYNYLPTMRSLVMYNVSIECNRNELYAVFTDLSTLGCIFYLHHLNAIYTVDNQFFGCFKDDCDFLLLNASSSILAISYGKSLYDFYIYTRSALEWHDFRSTKFTILALRISDPIIKMDFDWLNELVLILTPSKIYQINIKNKSITHVRITTNFTSIDAVADPINGLIHMLMQHNSSRFYTTLPSTILENISFSNLKSTTLEIPDSCSLILASDGTSIKILQSNSLLTFQLKKMVLVKDFDLRNANFQPPVKLQLKQDTYVVWKTNVNFEFNENNTNVHTFHSRMDHYASAKSINRNSPTPLISFVILNSFYGDNFLFVSWNQPIAKWQSKFRWKLFSYKLQLRSNQTRVSTINVNNKAHFRFYGLRPNSKYEVIVSTKHFLQSITGVTLNSKVNIAFHIFIIKNGTIKSMNFSLRTFKPKKYDSILSTLTLVKDIHMFQNCGFVLHQNGFITRLVNHSITHKLSLQNAIKMEVDFSTGNVFFIDGSNHWIYRYRIKDMLIYAIDVITPHWTDDFTLFPTLDVLFFGNVTGTYYTDLNGLSVRHSGILEIKNERLFCGDHFVEIIILRNQHRILSRFNNGSRFHCRSSALGIVMTSDSGISLRNWQGNSSLNLMRNHSGVSALSIKDSSICQDIYVKPIQAEFISISRSNSDDIVLSWIPENKDSHRSYLVFIINHNRKRHWTFSTHATTINLKNFSRCSDSIEFSIKILYKTTFSDTVTKNFHVPCTTKLPRITDLFITKKSIIGNIHRSLIEVQSEFQIYANTKKIDFRYSCVFVILFRKKFQMISEVKKSSEISCLDQKFSTSFEVDQNYQFELDEICGSISFHDISIEKCIGNEIMKTNAKEIILSRRQKYVLTYLNESINRIFIDPSGRSVSMTIDGSQFSRKILISETPVDKLEIDWIKNVLFWSERGPVEMKLFSVNLNGIKVNLREDRLLWINQDGIGFIWSIDTIERKLRITTNQNESIINLDYGPEWHVDHGYLVNCDKLINHRNILKCTNENISKNSVSAISSYFSPFKNLIIYENLNKFVCKIVTVKRNYVIPNVVSSCAVKQFSNVKNIDSSVLSLNEKTLIDGIGNVYSLSMSNSAQCNMSSIQFINLLLVKCYRNHAEVSISSSSRKHIFKLGIHYVNMESHENHSVDILDNPFNDPIQHDISINDLHPGIFYQFIFTFNFTNSKLQGIVTCQCFSKDDVPDSPVNVSILRQNFTHNRIMWKPGKTNGDNILDYKIKMNFQNHLQKFNSIKNTYFDIAKSNQTGTISVEARNIVGFSLPSYLSLKLTDTRKQISHYYLHSTMTFSTSLFLIIVLVSVSLILIISMYIHHRKTKRNNKLIKSNIIVDAQTFELMNVNQGIKYEINSLYGFEKLPLTNFDKIPHILNECLNYSHLIGNGAFGMVFKGTMTVESDNKTSQKPVALKIRNGKSISEEDFKREAVLLFKYGHPNIVILLGVSFDCPDKQCLILEYMEKGNLRQYLQHHRPDVIRQKLKNNSTKRLINENSILDTKDLISIASDILEALKFLEEKNFVHRDIAARNCLVSIHNKNKRITKLGDFGLARDIYFDEYYRKTSETKMPIRWMAPETIKDGIFSGKSDVWSFGVLCWEIMTFGADPYMGQTNAEVLKDVIDGKQLGRPETCPIDVYEMMLQCWKYYPECRPRFLEIDLIFQYFDGPRDIEETSTLSRLVMRSYNSSHESEFGINSDPVTEKTSIAFSEKYPEIGSLPPPTVENVTVRKNYDNLGYEVPLSPAIITKQESVFLHYSNDAN